MPWPSSCFIGNSSGSGIDVHLKIAGPNSLLRLNPVNYSRPKGNCSGIFDDSTAFAMVAGLGSPASKLILLCTGRQMYLKDLRSSAPAESWLTWWPS